MLLNDKIYVLLAAAGKGTRMGKGINKLLLLIKDKPIIIHTIETILSFFETQEEDKIGGLFIICAEEEQAEMSHLLKRYLPQQQYDRFPIKYVLGGQNRRASVANGIKSLLNSGASPNSIVMVHDGARCFASVELWQTLYEACLRYNAVCPGIQVQDTLRRAENFHEPLGVSVDRNHLYHMQTPQCARLDLLAQANARVDSESNLDLEFTDDVSILQYAGTKVYLFPGEKDNIKITTIEDLESARRTLL